MNILYLHSHDTGRAVQPYGYSVDTPNLSRLAREGVVFRDAHTPAPTCSPSRAALLTGETAHQAGMVALAHRGGRLCHPERHLGRFLAERGFETVLAGVQHVSSWKESPLYSLISEGEVDVRDGESVVSFAREFLSSERARQPFFLDVGFLETHRTEWVENGFSQPQHSPRDGDGDACTVLPPPLLPDSWECRRDWLDYRHAVERLDSYYGKVLQALDDTGLAEDTLVIATTDHGLPFPCHKCSLNARGTGVLLILRGPQGFRGGRSIDAMVSQLDLYPTLCDLLQIESPSWLQGKSLCPLVRGELAELRKSLFSEVTFHAAFEPKRGVRTKRWSYVRNLLAPHPAVLPNTDDGLSKRYLMEQGMKERVLPKEELYDLVFDPEERCNLALSSEHVGILEKLRGQLVEWMVETKDPLLNPDSSNLPAPIQVNARDQANPSGKGLGEWNSEEWTLAHEDALALVDGLSEQTITNYEME